MVNGEHRGRTLEDINELRRRKLTLRVRITSLIETRQGEVNGKFIVFTDDEELNNAVEYLEGICDTISRQINGA